MNEDEDSYFQQFRKDLSEITETLNLSEAIKSDKKGTKRIRDYLVFAKMAWTESLSYFAIIQSLIIFTALVPNSVGNVNEVLKVLRIPFQFPIGISSVIAIIFILFIFLFGIIAYRFFGLTRTANEIACRYSPGQFLMWKKMQEIKERLDRLEVKK